MVVTPIGSIRTAYSERADTPVQTALNPNDSGRVLLLPEYRDGLLGLDGFDLAWLLTWLGSEEDPHPARMRQVPFLLSSRPREIGLFAMRGPRRPNPIGLHLVRLARVLDDGFEFTGVDMLDDTPLLDVKPFAAPLDVPHGHALSGSVRSGWFDDVALDAPHTPRSLTAG